MLRKGDALWQKAEQVEGRSLNCGRRCNKLLRRLWQGATQDELLAGVDGRGRNSGGRKGWRFAG